MNLEQIKDALVGEWVSIAPEVRPSGNKNPDGTLKPFYLKRDFKYSGGDRFELNIVNSADPNAAVPLARIAIRGHMIWRGPHSIAAGAQKVDFVADGWILCDTTLKATSNRFALLALDGQAGSTVREAGRLP